MAVIDREDGEADEIAKLAQFEIAAAAGDEDSPIIRASGMPAMIAGPDERLAQHLGVEA
jgi:hypothetical protein